MIKPPEYSDVSPRNFRFVSPKLSKNCQCCYGSYAPYKIDEVDEASCILPLRDEGGRLVEPKGLCGSCNAGSFINFNPNLSCHKSNI